MGNLLLIVLVVLLIINKQQERQIGKLNRMLKEAEKRERDIRSHADQVNTCSGDVNETAKKISRTNAKLLGQLDTAVAALDVVVKQRDKLRADLDFEHTKNAIQDVHLDILNRSKSGTDRQPREDH